VDTTETDEGDDEIFRRLLEKSKAPRAFGPMPRHSKKAKKKTFQEEEEEEEGNHIEANRKHVPRGGRALFSRTEKKGRRRILLPSASKTMLVFRVSTSTPLWHAGNSKIDSSFRVTLLSCISVKVLLLQIGDRTRLYDR
jgi:hypothetical protein